MGWVNRDDHRSLSDLTDQHQGIVQGKHPVTSFAAAARLMRRQPPMGDFTTINFSNLSIGFNVKSGGERG
ncbi:hypothetical protein [Sphingomonas morindae]|uniref:Uncharacterized protein n=1 Tax=Sphingomonas morindae TaxID=1541170 RepID=A0ABY4XAK7_9SPHN|nr:hypothetical protein [Sphingomonas morindae]USI73908.1 hypothetical protein LHA26_05420 [Sphingomonas morindae]